MQMLPAESCAALGRIQRSRRNCRANWGRPRICMWSRQAGCVFCTEY